MPPEIRSKLEYTILCALFNTLDRKIFTDKLIFTKIIEEFQYLKEIGINIHTSDGPRQIYFDLALITGDNLGISSLLGFVENFNANFFCRFCLVKRSDISKFFDEKDCTILYELIFKKKYFTLPELKSKI